MSKLGVRMMILMVIMTSCSKFSGHLTKRYKSISVTEDHSFIKENIDVAVYAIDIEKPHPPVAKTFFDLSAEAQVALINNFTTQGGSFERLLLWRESKGYPLSLEATEMAEYSSFQKRLVVAIRNKGHWPADRISKITITLDFDTCVTILGCNRLTTDYVHVDLGKMHYSTEQLSDVAGSSSFQSSVRSNNLGPETSQSLSTGVSGRLSYNRALSEEILLQERLVALNAAISENKLSLYQEGMRGIDLTGNILADVTIGLKDLKVEKVYSFVSLTTNNEWNDADSIQVHEKLLVIPNLSRDVSVRVFFEADYRHVEKNDNTLVESDDRVQLYHGMSYNDSAEVILQARELQPKLWKISFDHTGSSSLRIKAPLASESGDLLFDSYASASVFFVWLNEVWKDKSKPLKLGEPPYVIEMPEGFDSMKKAQIIPNQ
jgi:hypothetical protein